MEAGVPDARRGAAGARRQEKRTAWDKGDGEFQVMAMRAVRE